MDDATALQLCLERDRLLSDPEFARSPSMCKLLRFLVEYKLSGNSVPLKSYTIATDALGRDANFDSQTDSYPRVQMGRLRRLLDNFYLRKGGENRLTIAPNKYEIILEPNRTDLQIGTDLIGESRDLDGKEKQPSKQPETESRPDMEMRTAGQRRSHRRFVSFLRIAILMTLIAILGYLLWPTPAVDKDVNEIAYPGIALDLPHDALGAPANQLSEAIGNHLIRGLNGFGGIRIFDIESSERENSGFIIKLRFLDSNAEAIDLRLLDRTSGEILWSEEINTTNEEAWKLELDKAIVALAGHYGEIAQAEMSKVGDNYSAGHPCLLQFDIYIRYREQEKLKPLRDCLQKSVERFPQDAHLLSVSAFAQNMSDRSDPKSKVTGLGMLLARKAEALDRNNAGANFAIAQSAFFAGDCATGVAWGKKAVELNSLNSRISGYLGLYMIACNMPEGESYAARALELDPNADLSIAAAVAFQMLKRGDAKSARQLSSTYMASSPRDEPALELTYILSSAMLNDKKDARRVWKVLAERYGLSETTPPREVLGRWIASPALLDEIMKVVVRSGMFNR
ncbi:hypothetical protein [Parasphingorhabdus sp.]|uniref:tetratricopeptide repeat protein n=1 Tax=Parasphingorhabdus sp. TaxID=2709688 RepID=UPI002B27497A|nr:hypothetical protein [Parasphingorhabdus sp.]